MVAQISKFSLPTCKRLVREICENIPKGQNIKYLEKTKLSTVPSELFSFKGHTVSEIMPLANNINAEETLLEQIFSKLQKSFQGKSEQEIKQYFSKNNDLFELFKSFQKKGQKGLSSQLYENINQRVTQNGIEKTTHETSEALKHIKAYWRSIFMPQTKTMSCEDKARKKLVELYDNVINNKSIPDRTRKNYAICKERIDSEGIYTRLMDEYYHQLRKPLTTYSEDMVNKEISNITSISPPNIRVKNENGWFYRLPQNFSKDKSSYRISINAKGETELIKKLDDIVINSGKGYYKTPENWADWLERHDPITIYLKEKPDDEFLKLLSTKCEKYIRSTDDVLVGKKFAPGFALETSPSIDEIEKLLVELRTINPTAEKKIRNYLTKSGTSELKASAGQITSLEKLIECIK